MKKKLAVVAMIVVVGVASGWAAQTTVLNKMDITLKGKLTPGGAAVTGATLAGNTNAISHLILQVVNAGTTNEVEAIGQVSGTNITVLLTQKASVDLVNTPKSDKFVAAFEGTAGSAKNAVLLINGTVKTATTKTATNVTLAGTFSGIWTDGSNTVAGTIASVKVKK